MERGEIMSVQTLFGVKRKQLRERLPEAAGLGLGGDSEAFVDEPSSAVAPPAREHRATRKPFSGPHEVQVLQVRLLYPPRTKQNESSL
eukprot:366209-Chlamydomonas_euryale.AAC.20